MATKKEMLSLYTYMVDDGEGDMLHAEILECPRLKQLYANRLHLLLTRDPKLALVKEGRSTCTITMKNMLDTKNMKTP